MCHHHLFRVVDDFGNLIYVPRIWYGYADNWNV